MGNGTAMILAAFMIGCGIAVSGAVTELGKQHIINQREAACWDTGVTTGLNSLATQEGTSVLKSSYPDDMAQTDQDAVSASFSATLSNYGFIGASDDGASVNCNASIAYEYTRPDGSKYTKDEGDLVSYEAHPVKGGWSAEMSSVDIPSSVVTYVVPPPPPVTAVASTPPPAVAAAVPPEVADYDQGHADRLAWEAWVNGLQGAEYQGAIFWSGQRSLSDPQSCSDGATAAYTNDAADQASFQNGCQEATGRLAPSDAKRSTDPLYKAGWNAPIPATPEPAPNSQ